MLKVLEQQQKLATDAMHLFSLGLFGSRDKLKVNKKEKSCKKFYEIILQIKLASLSAMKSYVNFMQ